MPRRWDIASNARTVKPHACPRASPRSLPRQCPCRWQAARAQRPSIRLELTPQLGYQDDRADPIGSIGSIESMHQPMRPCAARRSCLAAESHACSQRQPRDQPGLWVPLHMCRLWCWRAQPSHWPNRCSRLPTWFDLTSPFASKRALQDQDLPASPIISRHRRAARHAVPGHAAGLQAHGHWHDGKHQSQVTNHKTEGTSRTVAFTSRWASRICWHYLQHEPTATRLSRLVPCDDDCRLAYPATSPSSTQQTHTSALLLVYRHSMHHPPSPGTMVRISSPSTRTHVPRCRRSFAGRLLAPAFLARLCIHRRSSCRRSRCPFRTASIRSRTRRCRR